MRLGQKKVPFTSLKPSFSVGVLRTLKRFLANEVGKKSVNTGFAQISRLPRERLNDNMIL